MSEPITAPISSSGSGSNVTNISEAVIRIAGNSQDGIQAIGGFLARLAGRSEQEVMTFMTIPSTISGGPSIFQVRIGSGEVLSAGDEADVLLAFYQHSYQDHIHALKKGGIVLFDSDHVEPNEEWLKQYHHVGVPISGLTVEAIGGTARDKHLVNVPISDVVQLRAGALPASGSDEFYNLVGKTDFAEDKWISAVEIKPGDSKVVHHVILWQGQQGNPNGWIGAWAAGTSTSISSASKGWASMPGRTSRTRGPAASLTGVSFSAGWLMGGSALRGHVSAGKGR